jgi:thiosulfate/3-mercaptopyruvate sulfurtransferase
MVFLLLALLFSNGVVIRESLLSDKKNRQTFPNKKIISIQMQTLSSEPSPAEDWDLNISWILSPKQAKAILNLKGTIFLDSRNLLRRLRYPLPGAIPINWQEWSESKSPNKGNLLSKEKAKNVIQSLKIDDNSYIIVVGAGRDGWGEEARLVYSLREWGIKRAYWVDGGDTHFLNEKTKTENLPLIKNQNSSSSYTISKEVLSKNLQSKTLSIIDTREEREFYGSTPYGETRGGHIPGAKWIYYKDFYDHEGKIKSKDEIQKLLIRNNINLQNEIIPYCTGGVRSAFVTGILVSYGFAAKNYAGSMWEWSAAKEKEYPLEK